jgi:chromosome partitioning protein
MVKIISVANQKGGCGKTNITMNLAVSFFLDKKKVLVIDADPQGTASRWSASAEDNHPYPVSVINLSIAGNKIHQEIKKLMDKYDYIIVDCPPSIESVIPQSVLLVSDLVLIPIVPSPSDLWATVGMKKLLDFVLSVNETLRAMMVINMYNNRTILAKDVVEAIDGFDVKVANTKIGLRNVFRTSSALGRSVFDYGKDVEVAKKEIISLKKEIVNLLK